MAAMSLKTRRMINWIIMVGVFIFVVIQAIPVERTNPPVTHEIQWDSPETQEYFNRACADCHSHKTKWPVYAYIAPISWFVADHVNHGREEFNISTGHLKEAHEAAEMVEKGKMPLSSYLPLHPEARLNEQEKEEFIRGLKATFVKSENEGKDKSGMEAEEKEEHDH